MLRKSKILDRLTSALEMEQTALDGASHQNELSQCLQALGSGSEAFEKFCKIFSERAMIEPESFGIKHEYVRDYSTDYMDMSMSNFRWTVLESASGLFDMAQWLVSAMHKEILHGLPKLQKGFVQATYHNESAYGFYNFLYHDINHSNKFLEFALMWQKIFSEEDYVCQYLFERMWKRAQHFARVGDMTKVLETVVIYFYFMHEDTSLSLQETGAKWLESLSNLDMYLADTTYIDLVSRIADKELDQKGTQLQLSQWYRDHIVPDLREIVEEQRYQYYGPLEGSAVEK